MIRFFRTIRQRLLAQGRIVRYLTYAIGEILLVVIGILIALQVNNWNQQRNREAQEVKMLKELALNLRADSADHRDNIEFYDGVARAAEIIKRTMLERTPWHDSMEVHYGYLLRHGLATFNTSAYDNLRSIGFDLISNDSIRIALTNLHAINYTQVLKMEQELSVDNQTFFIAPVVLRRIRMERPWFQGRPHNHQALWGDVEFLEVVQWKATTMDYVADTYRTTLRRTTELIRMIERELEAREP